jgi:hypothetical protein
MTKNHWDDSFGVVQILYSVCANATNENHWDGSFGVVLVSIIGYANNPTLYAGGRGHVS